MFLFSLNLKLTHYQQHYQTLSWTIMNPSQPQPQPPFLHKHKKSTSFLKRSWVLMVIHTWHALFQISLKICTVQGLLPWILSASWLENVGRRTFKSSFYSLWKFLRGIFHFELWNRLKYIWILNVSQIDVFFFVDLMKHHWNINPIDKRMVLYLLLEHFVISWNKLTLTNLSWSVC